MATNNFPILPRLIASGLWAGYSPIMPGTCGTVSCLVVWYTVHAFGFPSTVLADLLLALGCIVIGHLSSGACIKRLGVAPGEKTDPQFIVIDEWAGMLIGLIGVSYDNPLTILMAFFLFRFFDILKPWPIKRLEHLPGAFGVMADDIAAGLFALLLFHGILSPLFPYVFN